MSQLVAERGGHPRKTQSLASSADACSEGGIWHDCGHDWVADQQTTPPPDTVNKDSNTRAVPDQTGEGRPVE
jgi:hypothetical protein